MLPEFLRKDVGLLGAGFPRAKPEDHSRANGFRGFTTIRAAAAYPDVIMSLYRRAMSEKQDRPLRSVMEAMYYWSR